MFPCFEAATVRRGMKLLCREPDKLVFRLSKREYEALLVAVRLRSHLPRQARSITSDTPKEARLREAQEDLTNALKEHRQELSRWAEDLLADPTRCAAQKGSGYQLTLSASDSELVLQTLNEVRIAAWEKLGCPNLATGDRPEISDENFLCFWAFQVTDMFQGTLLAALAGED